MLQLLSASVSLVAAAAAAALHVLVHAFYHRDGRRLHSVATKSLSVGVQGTVLGTRWVKGVRTTMAVSRWGVREVVRG